VSCEQKLNHLASDVCWCTVLLGDIKVKLSPQVCESDHFRHFFVAAMVKLQQLVISEPNEVHHQSRIANQQLSAQAVTSKFVLAAHYIMTSKEYLTNSHILSKYFQLVFLQLPLVKISCKLIII